jgi:mRNA degradation ribonuclease J1/J2
MRERYNPEDSKAYYEENYDRIRANQNNRYKRLVEANNLERLNALLEIADDAVRPFIEKLISFAGQLSTVDIGGVEKSVLLAGRKSALLVKDTS